MALEILIVDDERDIRELVAGVLSDEGYECRMAGDSTSALAMIDERRPSLVLLDVWLHGSPMDGLEVLDAIKSREPQLPVLIFSGHGSIDTAVSAIGRGAADFIEKPFEAERLLLLVGRATETERLRRENARLREGFVTADEFTGNSTAINQVRATLKRVANTGSRLLITGPGGSGKEVAARLLHSWSGRAEHAFVTVNSARITPERFEQELFGEEAQGKLVRAGLLEMADGGTLYLDEVADMPLSTQARILRVLTEQAFDTAEKHVLVESVHQSVLERLELWDTPGFGDSELLAKRMSQVGNPIGWFMSEVWDRLQNRAFWYSQRAVRHILDESDVVLYLINASEKPDYVAYLDAELKVLDLIGKPVVVLLNQVGDITTPELAEVELRRWKARVAKAKCVKDVLLLDAFTRCWVQEGRLLEAVAASLPNQQTAFARLNTAWQQRNQHRFQASMNLLAQRLCRAARDKESVNEAGWSSKFKEAGVALGKAMGLGDGDNTPKALAMKALSKRLDADIRSNMDALIALHHLDGRAGNLVLTRLAEHYAVQSPQSEGKAALWGGVVTGALMGLKADILSGGLTLGGGMLAGGVLGALGGAGLARGYNQVKGIDTPTIAWTPEVLDDLTRSSLLGYLAVAHFGRGRGEWTQTEPPAFWVERIEAALAPQWGKLHVLWASNAEATPQQTQTELQTILMQTSQTVLQSLYPEAGLQA